MNNRDRYFNRAILLLVAFVRYVLPIIIVVWGFVWLANTMEDWYNSNHEISAKDKLESIIEK